MMAKQKISFEKAMAELQEIVEALEDGNVDLDRSLALYERGIELVRLCNDRLDSAQQRVLAVQNGEEGPTTVPFEGADV